MTQEEQKLIQDAISRSMSIANGGVRTYVLADGKIMTNYVPFRKHNWIWTEKHSKFAIEEWKKYS